MRQAERFDILLGIAKCLDAQQIFSSHFGAIFNSARFPKIIYPANRSRSIEAALCIYKTPIFERIGINLDLRTCWKKLTSLERTMPFIIVDDLPVQEPMPGFKGKLVHSENMSVAHWRITRNSMAPAHSHPHEQVTMVIEGEFELTVAEEIEVLKLGVVAVVPPNVEHSGLAITDCHLVDIFYPVREEYRLEKE